MLYVDIVIGLAALQFLYFGALAGRARERYGIKAPATTGNETFERHFRVQMNTLESLLLFYPGIYLFSGHVSTLWAAILGAVYLVGRQIYGYAYVRDPASRGPGFGIGMVATLVLLVGGSAMALWHALH
ncbi:MAG: MAPEG family protein [Steroidobacteraceae bacterium]